MERVFVTGIGIISPLGETLEQNHHALKEGKCGITNLELFPTRYSEILPFAEIKTENKVLQEKLNAFEKGITRTTLLALHACNQSIIDSRLTKEQLESGETALIGATTVGGMCLTDELYNDANNSQNGSEYLSSYDFGSVSIYLQQKYSIGGIVNTINTACSSSANSIMYGARLIKQGFAKRAIVGGTDSLAKFTINGFNSLMILAPQLCKPFDKNRNGLNLGEGAAFLVLESESSCKGKKIYAELTGYCNSNDAFHPSSLSDEGNGPYLAMKGALECANLTSDKIDFINAHGTGTENNDEVEGKAMLRVFNNVPDFASTKSNIGHTLGAAGAIEAIYSIMSLAHQEIYQGLNFSEPVESTGLIPVLNYKNKTVNHVLSNSFGFGGNCSSLIFSKV